MSTIVFIDPTIPDYQSLTDGLTAGTQLVLLDPTKDGILQISEALKGGSFDAVHIVSHGTSGNLQLGTAQVNSDTIDSTYSSFLQEWSNYLTPGADILLYGCNVAQGVVGQNFVQQLHQLTGADIAASDNTTGSVVLGGDWDLEYTTGLITTPLAFKAEALEAFNSVLAAFTAGDIVVLRLGTGTGALSGAATAVFLDEYNGSGTIVQSIALPTAVNGNNRILTESGSATSEGALTLSADGRYLTLVGYDAAPGTASVTGTASSTTNRIVGRVDAAGTVDTSTRINSAYTGNNIRSAVTNDGSGFWVAGPTSTGLSYVAFGSTGASTTLNGLNSRVVNIFNGQLYTSSQSGSNVGVNTVGTGLPTSTNQTVTPLIPGLTSANSNAYAYVLLDRNAGVAGLDTLYIADQSSGLLKYSFDGTNWTARGSIAGTLTGLTGVINGSSVDLYGTNGTAAGNTLVKFTDSTAFNASLSGSFTTIATAATNTAFRGVAFAPTNPVVALPDLTVNQADSPDPVTVNNVLTYALTVSNSGTVNASGITVTYTLPNGVTFNSTTVANGFTASQSGNTVTFTGGSINAGNNAILNVRVTPTTTGTLTSGVATVDPNNTIIESNENNNTAAAITTTVNAVQVSQPPTIVLNTASTTDLLDANGALSPNVSGAVSGVINNLNDPARTLGLDFTIADLDTAVGSLTVTASSSNASVVPNANLTLTGSGASRNLKINPVGVGNTNIVVTVSDGSNSANYTIAYAASANNGTTTTQFLTGTSDASTAIAVGGTYFLEGDDENQVLRLYDYTKSGLPVTGFDFTSSLGLTDISGGVPREVDIEASTRVNNRIFWLGSESNNDSGSSRPNRDRIFATDISGTGSTSTLSYVGRYNFLREDIINWDKNNLHGKGANYYGLDASAASGVGSKQTNGYNIEGLEMAPDNTTAYVAFRAPEVPPGTRAKALIVPVTNFASLISTNGGTQGSAQFGAPIELDLGGRGIREIRKNANNQYIIIAGAAGEAGAAPDDFRLYTWDGNPSSAPQLRAATFPDSFKPEGIISVPDNLTATSQIQFISDDGDLVLYNDGTASKDLSQNNYKKFRTDSITLGNEIAPTITKIHDIQGNGSTFALGGTRTIEGIVVGAFLGSTKLNGFYVQEEDADADADSATSEAIFVFDPSGQFSGSVGDKVRATGTVSEFTSTSSGVTSSLTELTVANVVNLGASALPTVTNIQFPVTSVADLERYEGMLVNVTGVGGNLTVTEYFQLGRFGQVVLAATGASNQAGTDARLDQFTQFNAPSVTDYPTYLGEIAKRKIILDDGSSTSNPDPIIFGRGGNPLSASNTLRGGDTVASITGVLDERFEGYRVQTSTGVNFTPANPRPNTSPDVGGTLKVSSFNVLNYFNGNGAGGGFTTPEQRGAENQAEFDRQRNKTIAAIIGLNADVVGLTELENDGYGATSAIQDLVNGLNAALGAGTYAFINPGTSLGTDAIAVGLIYKPGNVTPVGAAAAIPNGYGSGAFDLVGRKPLAQTFQQISTGESFTAVINHFKSKSSSSGGVGDADAGDGQGLSNGTRTRQAQDLAQWLATNPTGTTDPDYLIFGDLNAYAKEQPLTTLQNAGYNNLLPNTSYSYVFDGQVGSLDHALANSSLASQVTGAEKWHINADEPSVLDYNTNFKSAAQQTSLYNGDPFRSSDHDPVVVGLNLYSINVIAPPAGRNPIVGTAGNDRIFGGAGAKTITTGAGRDEIVYTNINEVGHRITDFEVGKDKIVLTQLLDNLVPGGYNGTNAIADGYVKLVQGSTANSSILQIDNDGPLGSAIFRNFLVLDNVSQQLANNTQNFVF